MRTNNIPVAIAILAACNLMSNLDRTVLNLFVDPIRHTMGFSDLRISLIQGPAFALMFLVTTLPLGRLSDVGNRRRIIGTAVAVWSFCTAATGMAAGFFTMILARAGVAVGESALSPCAYSLLADLVPKTKVGQAIGSYTIGGLAGTAFAMMGGGALVSAIGTDSIPLPLLGILESWQVVFLVMGAIGLMISALVFLFIVEPPRGTTEASTPFRAVLSSLWQERAFYLPVYTSYAIFGAINFGFLSWIASYFIRTYHLPIPYVGLRLGALLLATNFVGPALGGRVTDWALARQGQNAAVYLMTRAFLILIPLTVLTFIWQNIIVALAGCFVINTIVTALLTVGPVAIQARAAPRMRAQLGAIMVMAVNLTGISVGPVAIAALTQSGLAANLGVALMIYICASSALGIGTCSLARWRKLHVAASA